MAESLGLKLLTWHIKSTTKAQQGLYEYDAVSRLHVTANWVSNRVYDIKNYIKTGKLWKRFHGCEERLRFID